MLRIMKQHQFIVPIQHVETIRNQLKSKNISPRGTYEWRSLLSSARRDEAPPAVSAHSFRNAPLNNFLSVMHKDVKVEVRIHDYDDKLSGAHKNIYWIASIRKIYGFMLLLRFEGMDQEGDEEYDFWMNIGSEELRHVGFCASSKSSELVPPEFIRKRHSDWPKYMLCKLHACKTLSVEWPVMQEQEISNARYEIGNRLELLDRLESTRVRPARIVNMLGRRICLRVSKKDMLAEHLENEYDKQVLDGVWLDEGSCLIFPVGWGAYNNYTVQANDAYRKHTAAIASALKGNTRPPYTSYDVSFEKFRDWTEAEKNASTHWEPGWKLECLDPLNSTFLELRVATCVEILKDGYIRIGFDGPEMEEECLPLHSTSPLLFPVGYGAEYGINVRGPADTTDFSWTEYLRQCQATAAPSFLFDEVPIEKITANFPVGGKLEAVDMCEPNLVCPATISAIKGRLLLIHFDGWEENIDQLFDYRSRNIFPVGWCEMYGYKLETPKVDDDNLGSPAKKSKKF